ncbi:hypothetical protein [Streptomyces mirabilis]|uniref:hypothetical protein n=1 Tax=Streptomyces mirabilis TaxID=68239 RepID=UPI003D9F8420
MLLRLPYLALTSMFTLIRLLPMGDRDKDAEILALRHQLVVLQRQIDRPRLTWPDRALLAALLHRRPRVQLRRLQLIVSPDTVLRWHRDLLRRRHGNASRPKRPGRPRTIRSVRLLVLSAYTRMRSARYADMYTDCVASLSVTEVVVIRHLRVAATHRHPGIPAGACVGVPPGEPALHRSATSSPSLAPAIAEDLGYHDKARHATGCRFRRNLSPNRPAGFRRL